MKRLLALLLAVVTILTLGGAALAADDNAVSPYWAADSTDENPKLKLDKNQIVLGLGETNPVVVLPDTYLIPGKEYTYGLYRVDQDYISVSPNAVAMTPITGTMLGDAELRIRTASGSTSVVKAKLDKRSGTNGDRNYTFEIETKETYGTAETDVEYNIIPYGDTALATGLKNASIMFKSGYRAMPESDITGLSDGDYVTINRNTPVILKEQFDTLASNYEYKAVPLTDDTGMWTFTTRVTGMQSANFITKNEVYPEIIDAGPDYDFVFLTFKAGIHFPTNGEMKISVSDISGGDGRNLHAYLYRDGNLTPIASSYDDTTDEIVFRTNYLGSFIVSTGELAELGEETPPDENIPDWDNNEHPNPPTGVSQSMSAMIALGILCVAASVVVAKKRKAQ
ncbi:MAG: hypothetical protein LBV27_04320 [Oscillospiraceae bacterium]|nr:hypothetical protein [Oscillospiraceae bacterium]